jgi:hypothetical protein
LKFVVRKNLQGGHARERPGSLLLLACVHFGLGLVVRRNLQGVGLLQAAFFVCTLVYQKERQKCQAQKEKGA